MTAGPNIPAWHRYLPPQLVLVLLLPPVTMPASALPVFVT
jgi:hypothetical protein